MRALFVSGTDTDIGKTFVSSLLCRAFSRYGRVTYFKPIQAGQPTDSDQIKELCPDINILQSTYQLRHPMSPNRAAEKEAVDIKLSEIQKSFATSSGNITIVEGAGGLLVPINEQEKILDLNLKLNIPCLLVCSTRLGTINHTLLSIEALKSRGVSVAGIVLNGQRDPGLKELLEAQSGEKVVFEVPNFPECCEEEVRHWLETDQALRQFVISFCEKTDEQDNTPLRSDDSHYVWHPFTQHGIVKDHPLITSARGSYLQYNGSSVLDGISSWWVNLLGHSHPQIARAVSQQASHLEHVIFAGFTHRPAIELSKTLIALTRKSGAQFSKVFFSDNGSTSVEVALKMAYQYHQQEGGKRKRFLAFRGSYHGDTIGAMSVGERKGFNDVFRPLMFDVDFVDPFHPEELRKAFNDRGQDYIGVIFEPMVQGASGMRMYDVSILNELQILCEQHQVLKICDEVFTGFYRTGKRFAFEHSNLVPDFLCLSKGLTGGFLPLAVTLCPQRIFEAFEGGDMRSAFLHGHSYTANPIACAAANTTMELLESEKTQNKIKEIECWTEELVATYNDNKNLFNGRSLGTIGAFEVSNEDPNYFRGDFSYCFHKQALEKGVLLRPLGGTVYTVPPYCIEKNELEKIYKTMEEVMAKEF